MSVAVCISEILNETILPAVWYNDWNHKDNSGGIVTLS